jgi:integrase
MSRKPKIPHSVPGFGRIWLPSYPNKKTGEKKYSSTWWMRYGTPPNEVRISTGCTVEREAYEALAKEANAHLTGTRTSGKGTVNNLLDLLIEDYKLKRKRSLWDVSLRVDKHLRSAFGEIPATQITSERLKTLVIELRDKELSEASINKILANLRRAFQLGFDHEPPIVVKIPKFPRLKENNARQGILDQETYTQLCDELTYHARLTLIIAYHTGMRRGEILSLKWSQVSLERRIIHLAEDQTKNEGARIIPIYGDMTPALEEAYKIRISDFVVEYKGKRVYSIKTAWNAALRRTGLPHQLLHDLRRTALTNMIKIGIPRHIAMKISGHKTESVFRRYLIGDAEQAATVGSAMEKFMEEKKKQMLLKREEREEVEKQFYKSKSASKSDDEDPSK